MIAQTAFQLGALALLAKGVSARVQTIPLTPLSLAHPSHGVAPSKNVSLIWGSEGTNLVNVTLEMTHPTVVLEDVPGVVNVDCSATTVEVTFGSAADFQAASSAWAVKENFVLITNHLGDCDFELERGFFVAAGFSTQASQRKITANAEKTDVASTAATTEIKFSSVPLTSEKRAIVVNDTGVTISNTLNLPSPVTLFTYAPYVTAQATAGDISGSVTFSGYLKYKVLDGSLDAFYVDVDTAIGADLTLAVDVNAPYSNTFKYTAPDVAYNVVDIPGIVTFGPALVFDIGADVSASGAIHAQATVGAKINDGKIHLDFVDSSKTGATGWTPTFSATADISEKAQLGLNPFIDVTVELQVQILAGLLSVSGGATASPKFINQFTLTASQGSNPSTGGCSQGVEIKSDFQFSVLAFITSIWSQTVYSTTVPIADKCYSWQ